VTAGPAGNPGAHVMPRQTLSTRPDLTGRTGPGPGPHTGARVRCPGTRDVAETMGVRLSARTLYAVISRLESQGLIEPVPTSDRRRPYRITASGAEALARQSERMSGVASLAQARLGQRRGLARQPRPSRTWAPVTARRSGWP
jgi:hypothetical protein